jgi:glycosyltransferase involved in cell wall biosynthesis
VTRLRILHVLEAARGGTMRHLLDLVGNAAAVEHHVAVPPPRHQHLQSGALYDTAAVEQISAVGAQVHYVDMRRTPQHPANVAATVALRRLVRQLTPDVIHGHSSVGGALGRIAAATTGVPAIYTPNGLATGPAAHAIERCLGFLASRLVAVSPSEALEARRLALVAPARIVIIPNGIDLSPSGAATTDIRAMLGLPAATPLVGSVARLVPQKAPEELVAVCAAVARQRPEPHFFLIGLGPLQDQLDEAVAAADLGDRWHQIPHLPDAASVLGQLDAFVLPSRFEGGPYTPLEAMRARTPVVLSDVVGNHDTVIDGVSGFLVPFGDSDTMATRVIALLDDLPYRQAIVTAAEARLHTHFDAATMGAQLSDLYREVAAEPRRRRTRKLPHPTASSSVQPPEASAAQYSS